MCRECYGCGRVYTYSSRRIRRFNVWENPMSACLSCTNNTDDGGIAASFIVCICAYRSMLWLKKKKTPTAAYVCVCIVYICA